MKKNLLKLLANPKHKLFIRYFLATILPSIVVIFSIVALTMFASANIAKKNEDSSRTYTEQAQILFLDKDISSGMVETIINHSKIHNNNEMGDTATISSSAGYYIDITSTGKDTQEVHKDTVNAISLVKSSAKELFSIDQVADEVIVGADDPPVASNGGVPAYLLVPGAIAFCVALILLFIYDPEIIYGKKH